ncbi:hypothetical protein Tco_0102320, partial [Tanacetum coccineum]
MGVPGPPGTPPGSVPVIVANEAFHYIRNKKKGDQKVMALELDLNKAFDRVEWEFLMAMCRKLGFRDK